MLCRYIRINTWIRWYMHGVRLPAEAPGKEGQVESGCAEDEVWALTRAATGTSRLEHGSMTETKAIPLYHWSAWPILSLSVNYDWFIDLPSVERMCMNACFFWKNIFVAHDGTQSMCQALQLMPLLDQWLMTPRRLSRLWTSLRCQFQQILCFQHHPQTSHRPRCGPTIKWRDPSPILLMTRDCFQ